MINIQIQCHHKDFVPIKKGLEYIESLKNRNLQIYLFGELVKEPVDHPMIRPSINAVAETYGLAVVDPKLGSTKSSLTGINVNRSLHIAESQLEGLNQDRMSTGIIEDGLIHASLNWDIIRNKKLMLDLDTDSSSIRFAFVDNAKFQGTS